MRTVGGDIMVVGGYGEVGARLTALLEEQHGGHVIVGGRHPERSTCARKALIDVDDLASVGAALDSEPALSCVAVCVRQAQPHLLRACVDRGLAYTSIASPQLAWEELQALHATAVRTGARIVLATGIQPGITSVLARLAADQLGSVDTIETALLLGVGDSYGGDSLAFIMEELATPYRITVEGRSVGVRAFERPSHVAFPAPLGTRVAYTMAFTDQLYYPKTLGAKTAIARLALDPPWLAAALARAMKIGGRRLLGHGSGRTAMQSVTERLRARYAGRDDVALVVETRGSDGRLVRSTLAGRGQAQTTAVAAAATVEGLLMGEQARPGVWLAEQVIEPKPFLDRLAAHGLVPALGTA